MEIKRRIAKKMIEIGAVKKGEFILSSGKKSRFYIDVKLACCYPELLNVISDYMAENSKEIDFDVIACIELGGVPIATALSLKTKKRMVIFRKKKKDYGVEEDMIGSLKEGEKVLVVEDVTTTGSSALSVVERIRKRKCRVECVFTVVDRKEGSKEKFAVAGVKLLSVLTIDELFKLYR